MKRKSNCCIKKYLCNNFSCLEENKMCYKSLFGEKEGIILLKVRIKLSVNYVLIIIYIYKIKLNVFE